MSEAASTNEAWPTTYIAIVPRLSGILSAASSSIIIFLILRSASRLSTIYHRIMFGMSVFDIAGSLAMALTSIMMPKTMPFEEELGLLSWPGARYGNTFTCNVQGFFATIGPTCMMGYNTSLCSYYAFAIALRMKEENIRKYIQPVILIVPIIFGLITAVPPLFNELYNPPIHQGAAWCIATTYPSQDCTDTTCIRGKPSVVAFQRLLMHLMSGAGAITVIVSLTLVVGTVWFRPAETIQFSSANGYGHDDKCTNDNGNANDYVNGSLDMSSSPLEEAVDLASNSTPSLDISKAIRSSQGDYDADVSFERKHYNIEEVQTKMNEIEAVGRSDDRNFYEIETRFQVNNRAKRSDRDGDGMSRSDAKRSVGEHQNNIRDHEDDNSTKVTGGNSESEEIRAESRIKMNPKVLAIQASAYILVYLLTALWFLFLSEPGVYIGTIFKVWLFIFPLHGLFNLIIFLCHKVYNYRRLHSDEDICEVLNLLFNTPIQEPCFITRISMVSDYHTGTMTYTDAMLFSDEMGDRIIARKSALFVDRTKSSQHRRRFSEVVEEQNSYRSGFAESLELQSEESFVEDSSHGKISFGESLSSYFTFSRRSNKDEVDADGVSDQQRSIF